jgi:hypothetical protein
MHNDSKIAQLGDNNFGRVVQENGLQMSMVNQYGIVILLLFIKTNNS